MAEMEREREVQVQVEVEEEEEEEEEPLLSRKESVEKLKQIFLENKKSLASEIASRLMEDVEEPLEFRAEWVRQVIEMVDRVKESPAKARSLPRVARALLNVNPEAYKPQFLSLGPYHHWKLQKNMNSSSARGSYEQKMSTGAEAYKVKCAATLSHRLPQGKGFHRIVETIQAGSMLLDIADFYDWPITSAASTDQGNYSQNFARMMVVDSIFLLHFLFSLFSNELSDPDIDLSTLQICIKCDILKLENQIPLSVLKHVFENLQSLISEGHQDFNQLLQKAYKELSPFDQAYGTNIRQEKEPHLLGSMHAFVSPFLQMQPSGMDDVIPNRTLCEKTQHFVEEIVTAVCSIFLRHPTKKGRRDFLNAYNAGQLARAGIKFKSFSKLPHKIRFDKYTDTFYLPRITVSHVQTEVFLRNMLALEFNDPARRNCVTRYVGLMDCLIDTPDDVRLLRDSHVIRRRSLMLTDESIANMWNGMCQPFFTGHLEPPDELKQALEEELIKKYYKSKIKNVLREFYSEHLSSPFKVVALLIGFCVLAMTVIQAYCSMTQCEVFSHSKSN